MLVVELNFKKRVGWFWEIKGWRFSRIGGGLCMICSVSSLSIDYFSQDYR